MATAGVSALDVSQDDDDGDFPWSFRLRTIAQSDVEEEVDPDVYLATLYEISFTDEMEIETADDGAIRISFASCSLLLPSILGRDLRCSGDVSGRQLRYAAIQPQHMEDSHTTVWLSVWTPDCTSTENVYIRMEDLPAATRLLNALRRLRFVTDSQSTIWLEMFYPRIAAFYDVCVELKSGTDETTPVFQPRFCVVDEEAFAVYANVVDVSPMILLRFQREPGRDVIDCMYMNKKRKTVKIVNDSLVVMVRRLHGAPIDEITAPVEQVAAPVAEMAAPVEQVAASVDEMAAPVEQVAASVDQVAAPVDQVAAPVDEMTAPVDKMSAPVDQVEAPVDQVAAPVEQVAAPVEQVAAPVDQVAAPVEQVAAPVATMAAPVEQVVASVDEMAAPVEQVAAPVDQVAAPVDEMKDDQQIHDETRTPVGDYDQLLNVLKDIKCKPAAIFKDIEAYKKFFTQGSIVECHETRMSTPPLGTVGMEEEEEIEDITPSDPEDVRLVLWEMAAVEMTGLIEDGLVPETTMISAGLNPTSKEDFQKCIGEIQDAIFAREYGKALSYINGVREVFSPSLYNPQLTQLMDYDNTLKILKHVFFAADRVIRMCRTPS